MTTYSLEPGPAHRLVLPAQRAAWLRARVIKAYRKDTGQVVSEVFSQFEQNLERFANQVEIALRKFFTDQSSARPNPPN